MRSQLPQDKPRLLELLDHVLSERDERMLKPEWMRGL